MGSKAKRAQLLAKTPVFEHLSEKQCQMLAPVFKDRSLDDGEVLCREGDTGDYLAIVVLGTLLVDVEREGEQRTVVATVGPREVVGEMSCLDPLPRSATVRAKGNTQVLILTRNMLDSLKTNAPKLFSRVVRGIAYRLAGRLDETNALISKLLQVKREPTQPRQPSLREIQNQVSSGRPVKERVELSSQGVLETLADNERQVLRTAMEARRYGKGEVICVEGAPASEAYFVARGSVDVLKSIGGSSYRLATMAEGGFLGQRALLREGKRSATIRSGELGATLHCLSRDRFEALLEAESSLAIGFQEVVTITGIRQLRQANQMAAYLGTREEKDGFVRPLSSGRHKQPSAKESVEARLREMIDSDGDESEDIEVLASAYLQTALEDWDLTPSELDKIEAVRPDGEMSAAEKKMRDKYND